MASVADILIEGRGRRNWSQAELAFRAGVSNSTVSRAEQGRGVPNVNSVRRLAEVIGCDPDALAQLAGQEDDSDPAEWFDRAAKSAGGLTAIPGVTTGNHLVGGGRRPGVKFQSPPRIVRVPHFGSVSAVRTDHREGASEESGQTSDVPDVGVDFTVTVDGQCMEPRYEDGECVGCSIGRWEKEGFVWGKDYWIRFRDGETTLKRVKADPRNHEKFICTPLNPKARSFSRFKADVAKAARVLVVLSG